MKLALQALVVVFVLVLGVVAVATSGRLAGWLAAPAEPPRAAAVPAPANPAVVANCLDEAEIRRVIREELAVAAAAMVPAQAPSTPGPADVPPAPVSPPEQVARVNLLVDQYIQTGVISDAEMARLQSQIAKLDPAARRAAMQRIVRAMNSGALDGRL